MRAKKVNDISFIAFVEKAPKEIQEYIEKSKGVRQTKKWHPEVNVYTHIKVVFNRAAKTRDIDLILAALFHDLGKMDVTRFKEPETWSSHGHEFVSAKLVEKYKDWIESLGGDFEKIYWLVKEHMRVKYINDMRQFKQDALRNHSYFSDLEKFSGEFDNMKLDYSNDLKD